MLFGLERLKDSIAENALSAAQVYGDRRLYRRRVARVAPGMLLCPVCGASARRFLAFGLHRRRNAECPSCGSVERHRLLWLYLSRHTDLARGRHRVLHTAPEPCLADALARLPNLRTRSVDGFNPHADVRADLTDLPFADRRFDVVLSSHVLEHIPDDRRAMREICRVLKPGGTLWILESHVPRKGIGHELTKFVWSKVIPGLTYLATRSRDAKELMDYYWDTIDQCVDPKHVVEAMRAGGFDSARSKVVVPGAFCEYIGMKAE